MCKKQESETPALLSSCGAHCGNIQLRQKSGSKAILQSPKYRAPADLRKRFRIAPYQVAQTADINTVADLYLVVKQKDKNFGPETASKVVNADGRRRWSSIRPGRTSRSSTFAKTARARATMKRRKARIYKKNPAISTIAGFLVRVVIQNFLKKPVISTVFKADE